MHNASNATSTQYVDSTRMQARQRRIPQSTCTTEVSSFSCINKRTSIREICIGHHSEHGILTAHPSKRRWERGKRPCEVVLQICNVVRADCRLTTIGRSVTRIDNGSYTSPHLPSALGDLARLPRLAADGLKWCASGVVWLVKLSRRVRCTAYGGEEGVPEG
jgi:hypothetical protein